jgi:hypothetical protein
VFLCISSLFSSLFFGHFYFYHFFFLHKPSMCVKAHYNDPLWNVILYYFQKACMFECIPFQKI